MGMKYKVMYINGWAGVIEMLPNEKFTWVIEPEYNSKQAEAMTAALNKTPDLNPEELTKIVEAA
jgi:hypothetical protein